MNETLYLVDGRTALRTERRLRHRPAKVWHAVTEPSHLEQWFPFRVEVDLRVGGVIRFLAKEPDGGPTTSGVVTEVDEPRVFAFTWGDDDDLRFELSPDGDEGCLLVLTHTFADHYGGASFTTGWQVCLDAMEAMLDGREYAPPRDMAPMHDDYVVALGLDEGTVDDTGDGWQVRFERQMTRPAPTVWAALTHAGVPSAGGAVPAGLIPDGVEGGAVTAVDEPKLVEYDVHGRGDDRGRVRVELGEGTGQGARLVVTQTGPAGATDARAAALRAWKTHIDALAARLRETAP